MHRSHSEKAEINHKFRSRLQHFPIFSAHAEMRKRGNCKPSGTSKPAPQTWLRLVKSFIASRRFRWFYGLFHRAACFFPPAIFLALNGKWFRVSVVFQEERGRRGIFSLQKFKSGVDVRNPVAKQRLHHVWESMTRSAYFPSYQCPSFSWHTECIHVNYVLTLRLSL